MALIKFVANYEDLPTDRGYQFKFCCDKCGNGYMSRFQTSVTGTAGGLLRAAGGLFGGVLGGAGDAAYEIQRSVGGKAHDEALNAAVQEADQASKFCPECGAPMAAQAACAKCGAELAPGAKFCPECGQKTR